MPNKYQPGCTCCGCFSSASPKLYPDLLRPSLIHCIVHTVIDVDVYTFTRTIDFVYVGGVVVSEVETVTTADAATVTTTSDTIDDKSIVGHYSSQVQVTVPVVTNTWNPVDAQTRPGGIGDATRRYVATNTRTTTTTTVTRRLVVQFDVREILSFGDFMVSQPLVKVIRNASLGYSATAVGAAPTFGHTVRGIKTTPTTEPVTIDALPATEVEFDDAFAATPAIQVFNVVNTAGNSHNILTWLPSSDSDTLTFYFHTPAGDNASTISELRLVVAQYLTTGDTVVDWRDYYSYESHPMTGVKTWMVLRQVPSQDIQFNIVPFHDATDSPVFAPFEYTVELVDEDDIVIFSARFQFEKVYQVGDLPSYAAPPSFFPLNSDESVFYPSRLRSNLLYKGILTLAGLGTDETPYEFASGSLCMFLCFYDDSLTVASSNASDTNSISLGPGLSPTSASTDLVVWRDDESFYVWGSDHCTFELDTIAERPPVTVRVHSPNANLIMRSINYKSTQPLTAIGQPRVPYDELLDESTDPGPCGDAVTACRLIGTEEQLRLHATSSIAGLQVPTVAKPMGAVQCEAINLHTHADGIIYSARTVTNPSDRYFMALVTPPAYHNYDFAKGLPLEVQIQAALFENDISGMLELKVSANLYWWGFYPGNLQPVWRDGPFIGVEAFPVTLGPIAWVRELGLLNSLKRLSDLEPFSLVASDAIGWSGMSGSQLVISPGTYPKIYRHVTLIDILAIPGVGVPGLPNAADVQYNEIDLADLTIDFKVQGT